MSSIENYYSNYLFFLLNFHCNNTCEVISKFEGLFSTCRWFTTQF